MKLSGRELDKLKRQMTQPTVVKRGSGYVLSSSVQRSITRRQTEPKRNGFVEREVKYD